MTCDEYRHSVIERERGSMRGATPDLRLNMHADSCADCSRFEAQQQSLTAALRAMAAETPADAPPFLETRLLAEVDSVARHRPFRWWSPALVSAAAACLAVVLLLVRVPTEQLAGPVGPDDPFIEIPYVLPPAPYERIEMKRMDVPVATLMATGLVVEGREPPDSVPADVLVGQDGRVHAVRLASSGASQSIR
jgi:hypothetical protein